MLIAFSKRVAVFIAKIKEFLGFIFFLSNNLSTYTLFLAATCIAGLHTGCFFLKKNCPFGQF
jgi:hypothetical protein